MKYCKNCGVKIVDDARFCAGCGFKHEIVASIVGTTPFPVAIGRGQEIQSNNARVEHRIEDMPKLLAIKKWEYLIVNILSPMWVDSSKRSGKIDGAVSPLLSQLGDEGWELILGKIYMNMDEGETTVLTFKRPGQ